jgi:diguanylate cyclase (GGDEF)-like protein
MRVQHLAHHDVLTDLPNRTLFADRLQQSLAKARRDKTQLAVMYLDLDNFKPVNDTLGHAVGDLLLKDAARRMRHGVRESDTVARAGGDEFVVLLPAVESAQDALAVAEKIRHVLSQPFELAGHIMSISASIGVAVYPEHGQGEEALLKNADAAMYLAKQVGRNNVKLCG